MSPPQMTRLLLIACSRGVLRIMLVYIGVYVAESMGLYMGA